MLRDEEKRTPFGRPFFIPGVVTNEKISLAAVERLALVRRRPAITNLITRWLEELPQRQSQLIGRIKADTTPNACGVFLGYGFLKHVYRDAPELELIDRGGSESRHEQAGRSPQ
jgi:hypothetical protein